MCSIFILLMVQKSGINSPVEGKVLYSIIFGQGLSTIQTVVGNGISEPSTVPSLKTNISPEKWWLEDVFPTEIVPF